MFGSHVHAELSKNIHATRNYCVKKDTRAADPFYYGDIGVKGKVRLMSNIN